MAQTAKLPAYHFVGSGFDRLEPHRNYRAGDRILRDAHALERKVVNHIFGRELDDDGASDRNVQFAEDDEIVFAGRIGRIEAERI